MAKPSINQIAPFDAENDYTVKISYLGNLPYANRLIIYAADSMSVLYDEKIESFQLEHTIPAYTLINGRNYAVQCQFFDRQGNASPLSDKIFFLTLTEPVYYFENIVNGMTIETSSISATIHYEQEQFEDVRSYTFYIYDSTKNLLASSDVMYDYSDISYVYKGLSNETSYYIRWIGVTDNGIQLDTGYVFINVKYENPNTYARMYVECDKNTSAMNYYTNFKLVEASNDDGTFEYDMGYIYLDGKTLVYDKDYVIPSDATWYIKGRNLFKEATILRCGNENYGFELKSYLYGDGILRFKLIAPNGLSNYVLYSEPLSFEEFDVVTIFIRRIGNVYQLKCYVDYEPTTQPNMYFGSSKPGVDAEQYDIWIDLANRPSVRVDKNNITVFYQSDEPESDSQFDVWIGDKINMEESEEDV